MYKICWGNSTSIGGEGWGGLRARDSRLRSLLSVLITIRERIERRDKKRSWEKVFITGWKYILKEWVWAFQEKAAWPRILDSVLWANFKGGEDYLWVKVEKRWGISRAGQEFPQIGFIPLFCSYMGFSNILWYHIYDEEDKFLRQKWSKGQLTVILVSHVGPSWV
jgi:hypothetical protein